MYDNFQQAHYPIFLELEEKWYQASDLQIGQRQFLVQDPDGYLLRFIERISHK